MASGERIGKAEKSGGFYRGMREVGSVALLGADVILKPIGPLMRKMVGLNLLRLGGGALIHHHAHKRPLGEQGSH